MRPYNINFCSSNASIFDCIIRILKKQEECYFYENSGKFTKIFPTISNLFS
uniref:Uncharacterized protein n=1 Tax=Siphoviridae sp. ct9mC1 TaxID=2827794 RepID=A0A8S5SEN2_9CAUD|nr:MAG TPA: hypothetical protein [Siphoviridae sp. ct9mC1]